jgi:hypothetical protein
MIVLITSTVNRRHSGLKSEYLFARFDCTFSVKEAAINMKDLKVADFPWYLGGTFHKL